MSLFEIFGEVAEYNRNLELVKIEGSPRQI